jgi:transposase
MQKSTSSDQETLIQIVNEVLKDLSPEEQKVVMDKAMSVIDV